MANDAAASRTAAASMASTSPSPTATETGVSAPGKASADPTDGLNPARARPARSMPSTSGTGPVAVTGTLTASAPVNGSPESTTRTSTRVLRDGTTSGTSVRTLMRVGSLFGGRVGTVGEVEGPAQR